eukprot:CAMPEP_0206480562 /NCGR_PEP_ID=MMETSP0324_2-20121206/37448_1 /ASSEMBLY_ACC=CAM_ASM_000836 /TAXON_ID=2866 /ORGANISM="Crypthecodinium cohnii, Strain Seligo" /LENGTH=626 /DNA_ID=CAMNT_0053957533 /DNA_START=78 /DNA_END=1958 /DNA_ORIENTATION=+
MASSSLDALRNADALVMEPLGAIDALFQKHFQGATPTQVPDAWGEKDHFKDVLGLQNEENFQKIPCLNDLPGRNLLRPNTLFRFRGLVQDIFEPEVYASAFEERSSTGSRLVSSKYREALNPTAGSTLEDIGREGLKHRGVCYVVPLPAESEWARKASRENASSTNAAFASCQTTQAEPQQQSASKKRSKPEDDVEMEAAETAPANKTAVPPSAAKSGDRSEHQGDKFGLNFPIPSEEKRNDCTSIPCLVKLYDQDCEALRICETVEVVGVLCINPELSHLGAESGHPFLEGNARQPSYSMVPRLHALFIRKLPFYHPLVPFTPEWISAEDRLAAIYNRHFSAAGSIAAARSATLACLTAHMHGDEMAAEYLLLLLASRCFGRNGESCLGSWSLNLARWPLGPSASQLAALLGELMPRSVFFPVTADSLNSEKWMPVKDYEADRLVAGKLQLATGTVAVFDETVMAEGQLTVQGTKNLQAAMALVKSSKVGCDFVGNVHELETEVQAVVLSVGKPLLRTSASVPLIPNQQAPAAPSLSESDVQAIRLYLALVSRQLKMISIPKAVEDQIARDFSTLRQSMGVDVELISTWMSLARASCFSHGEAELSLERWTALSNMEKARLQRCG